MLHEYATSPLSILPALLTIILAIATHRVLFSISIGALLGALMLFDFAPVAALSHLKDTFISHLYSGDGLNLANVQIISFLFMMGIMIELMTLVGATNAFANWASARVHTRGGAKWMISVMALIFFIDDYFHALAAGNISRPIADRYKISRAKLAYLLDSTAAPICVVTPVSSWGAYIIALITGIFATLSVTDYTPLGAFLCMIPMTFYTIFTLMVIGLVCFFDLNIGKMYTAELEAASNGAKEIERGEKGSIWMVVGPIGLTTFVTLFMMFYTGSRELSEFSILASLENTDMGISLLTGALAGLSLLAAKIGQIRSTPKQIVNSCWEGLKAMWPAVSILLFAWTIGSIVDQIGTGKYLASLANAHISPMWMPVLIFFLAGFMAFSTGTSWGTFAIMLPLAANIAVAGHPDLLLPLLSAVLSGAVFGDHCSPISDTTILSASGAGCCHMTHVLTQLPYAIIGAVLTGSAYLTLGYTGSIGVSLLVGSGLFIAIAFLLVMRRKTIAYEA